MITMHNEVKKAVIRSQHCQRNFDLTKEVPQEDVDLLVHAATNCPSKQNIRFYNLHVFTDLEKITKIHEMTTGVDAYDQDGNFVPTTNSQTMANVLFVFERREIDQLSEFGARKWTTADLAAVNVYERDLATATGIAAGYVNVTAGMLGYGTGCCQCFQIENIKEYLGLENDPVLLMGIGFKNGDKNRRVHATEELVFPTRKKEEIVVTYNK